jgi:hypothetical protein
MGKAARNEGTKITANYLNNIAAALFVGGVAVPFLGAVSHTDEEILQWFASLLTWKGVDRTISSIAITIITLGLSFGFHFFARIAASLVED